MHPWRSLSFITALALSLLLLPASAAPSATIRLLFTGDNCLGDGIGIQMRAHGIDYPYANVAPILQGADLVFGNLECPITDATEPTAAKSEENLKAKKEFLLKADPALAGPALKAAGFDVMSVANNHSMDFRSTGMRDTLAALKLAGVIPAGGGRNLVEASSPRIVTVKGLKIGILACSMINPLWSGATNETAGDYAVAKWWTPWLGEQLRVLSDRTDLTVLSVHWGVEATAEPTDYQRDIATKALAAGADLVIGHHPHVLQPFERRGEKVIAYSLGNFCFEGKSPRLPSAILEVTAGADGVQDARLIPLELVLGRPQVTDKSAILAKLRALGPDLPLATNFDQYISH